MYVSIRQFNVNSFECSYHHQSKNTYFHLNSQLVGVSDTHLKVGVGLLTAGGGVAGGGSVCWTRAEGA